MVALILVCAFIQCPLPSMIDAAHDNAKALFQQVSDYSETVVTESETRLKAIDRVLLEVLNWGYSEISAEERSGSGYLDYRLNLNEVDRNSKRAVSGEWGKSRYSAGASMGRIVGNCQPNGASWAGIGGAVAARRAGFGVGTIRQ